MSQLALAHDASWSLPAELTAFVGRRLDRAELRRLLSESRLVTLTGLGGVGKTRLALQVAAELRRATPDGVWFVPLAELSDPGLIADVTAAVLGIHDRSGEFGAIRLAEYLRPRELLLVLDNCEHLVDDCAVLADTLLRSCPRLRILATSREAMRIAGETVLPVTPLSVPPAAHQGALNEYESVRLFVERATQVISGFSVDEENRAAVLGICEHLEGIPLALELAAVRLRAMSPSELLEGLREHWLLLDIGSRSAPGRHRTMSACIEWSSTLCSPAERDLWERLSVFAGGFEMDAIQYVGADIDASATRDSISRLVQSLVDKSILTIALRDGRARYTMHEVLRQFGLERLESAGSLKSARRAHRDFYADLLARVDADWISARQVDWMRRLRREEANLRLALEFCCTEPGEATAGLELASRLRKYALAYGALSEVRGWLHRLLPLVPEHGLTRFRGLRAACGLAALQGDRQDAESLLAEAQELARDIGSPAIALVDQVAGWHQMLLGDFAESLDNFERALDGLQSGGNLRDIAETRAVQAMTYWSAGDLERATAAHQACIDICQAAGESWYRSFSLLGLGLAGWSDGGDRTRSVELVRLSLELKRRMDDRLGVALCLEALAWMHAGEHPSRSARLLGAADALWTLMATSLEANSGLFPIRQDSEKSAREALGSELFTVSYAEGAQMDLPSAIAYALEEKPAPGRDTNPEPHSGPAVLTKREHQIAELLATGLTNEDIARKLVISRRTVETHVEHILVKLGFTSRTQVAVWVSERSKP
ncbi:LuxR family transcriptional regulator [Nocardioides gansuensis]|uniref:LuxR family transcriptional regulator n=1 Tax=Nocardioides gansuensis TaxID=2138300 RepID=A0A2T8F8N1_9ACTN|nr:LuxR C-terminal-related transcriptional regulator [Nocardioides gansuensis]PVG82088.1 LuxR family transcriptional regulator [Nocardioides gansuensis]